MNHVPEVQDPADRAAGGVDQQVCRMAISMYRLAAQRPDGRQPLFERQDHLLHRMPYAVGLDVRSEFHEFGQTTYIPGDALGERRMEESLQRLIDPRQGVADVPEERGPGLG